MTVVIEVHQDRILEAGPDYIVETSITAVQDIDRSIFVFDVATQVFDHVAYPYDMENYPDNRNDALTAGIDYYRLDSARVSYGDDPSIATDAAAFTLVRVDRLAKQYEDVIQDFEGSSDYVFPEDL